MLRTHNTAFMCSLHCKYIYLNVHGRSLKLFAVLRTQSVSVGFDQAWGSPCHRVCYLRAYEYYTCVDMITLISIVYTEPSTMCSHA
jgi:hypothetical protein